MNIKILKWSILIIGILLCSCSRDDEQIVMDDVTIIKEEITVIAGLYGLVVGPEGRELPQVTIELAGKSAITDENGFFQLSEVDVSSEGSLVTGTKEGYHDAYKFTFAEEGSDSYLKIQMVPKVVLSVFSSSEAVELETNGGAIISLPANITRRLDGTAYDGAVSLIAHWYGPDSEDLAQVMPGDLRGQDTEGNTVQLTTYGMMAVDLVSSDGEKLQLAEGQTAQLRFPITSGSNPPQSIPMWHLDEATGVWMEEGAAEREGDFLVAEVPHFSFWNCDAPFDVVNIQGRLISTDGLPVGGQLITITNDQNLTASGYTNLDGIFRGKVPSGEPLIMVVQACGERIEIPFGPLAEDTDLGTIEVDGFTTVQLTTNLIDCMSDPVSNGYLVIRYDDEVLSAIPDENGVAEFSFLICESTDGEYFAFDVINIQQSEINTFDAMQIEINDPDLEVCEELTEEFITFGVSENLPSVTFDDAEVTILDDKYIHIYATSDTSEFYFDFVYLKDVDAQSDFEVSYNMLAPWTDGTTIFNWQPLEVPYLFEPVSVFEVGDVIVGSVNEGNTFFDFVLKVDRSVSSGTAQGEIWEDTNLDGINDPNEPRAEGLIMTYGPSEIGLIQAPATTGSDGSFEFELLIPGREYKLGYRSGGAPNVPIQPTATLPNQGSDDSIDSDFSQTSFEVFETMVFTAEEGVTVTFDLGVVP